MSTLPKIIAVDFDGTLFENAWPDVGAPIEKNINKLKAEQADGAKVILWTNRVGGALDKAVNFCKEHGIHLDAVNENLPEIVQGFGTDCRKIFANEYWDDHAVWMSKQDIGEFSDGFHTFNSLYHQRLILFAALVNTFPSLAWKSRKHSDGEVPFGGGWFIVGVDTPKGPYTYHYEDKDWDLFHCREIETAPEWDGHTDKDVAEDGTVTYSDVNRVQLINKESPDIPFRNGFGTRLIDKMYPITLPYFPADKKFKIIVEEFLTDEKNGDFDTVGYLQLILPNGEVVDLNGYFKDGPDGMIRIEQAEYEERKARRIDKK